jgi:lysophospholipase L1-like esterase
VAYPRLIAGTSAKIPPLGTGGFRACSGAVTTNVTDLAQWDESIQLDWWLDATTQLVTLTIGGNDVQFSDFATACVLNTCQVGSTAYNTSLNEINNNLPTKLEATYKRILQYAPNAEIYVLGYPQVVASKQSSDQFDSRCFYMYNSGSNSTGSPYYPREDSWAARDIVAKLNTKISIAVANVRALNTSNTRLTYVQMDAAGSPFIGHEVCGTDSTSWFQNVDQALNNLAYVFHPNDLGQEGYATVAGATINFG